ncbi:hypothetical protein ACIBQ1_42630 [Nonomuraea sp. NPDC050153]|uniref:hypothetical protein n=1 Tax=Nonomuraea sp. NPDC050153 TaxID=3364359 RepID=UPI00378F1840
MAQAADECITKVSGIDTVGPQVVRHQNTSLLTQMITELEARLTELASGWRSLRRSLHVARPAGQGPGGD